MLYYYFVDKSIYLFFYNRTTINDSLFGTVLYWCVHTMIRRSYSRAGPTRCSTSFAVTIGRPVGARDLSLRFGA